MTLLSMRVDIKVLGRSGWLASISPRFHAVNDRRHPVMRKALVLCVRILFSSIPVLNSLISPG